MNDSPHRHLTDLLKGIDTAMLITRTADGGMHARPMGVAEISDDGDLYFVTSVESPKVKEIESDSRVTLVFQGSLAFVSLSGDAEVVKDAGLVDRLWTEAWRIWFPKGKSDPSLRLLRVDPHQAEYWDSSGTEGIGYALAAAKAYIKGKKPEISPDKNAKLAL